MTDLAPERAHPSAVGSAEPPGPWFVGLDIETDTADGNGLDPREAPVLSYALCSATQHVVVHNPDRKDPAAETALLTALLSTLAGMARYATVEVPVIIATWNGSGFDWPFLDTRLALRTPTSARSEWPWRLHLSDDRAPKYEPIGDHPGGYRVDFPHWPNVYHLDVAFAMREWCEHHDVKWSLKPVMAECGIEPYRHGENLGAIAGELSPPELIAYNLSDALGTAQLARRVWEREGGFSVDPRRV